MPNRNVIVSGLLVSVLLVACDFYDGDYVPGTETDNTTNISENGVCGPGTKCCHQADTGSPWDCLDSDSEPIPGCGDQCDYLYWGLFPCPTGFRCHLPGLCNDTDGEMGICYPEAWYPDVLRCTTADDCPCIPDNCDVPVEVSCSTDGFCAYGRPADLPVNY
jgi:hypothetical protein